jgi:hypothetical protein
MAGKAVIEKFRNPSFQRVVKSKMIRVAEVSL